MLSFIRSYALPIVLMLVGAFFAGLFFREVAEETVLDEATIIAQQSFKDIFNAEAWYRYGDTIAAFNNPAPPPEGSWGLNQQFIRFLQTVGQLGAGLKLPIIRFQLYKADGELFYTSLDSNMQFTGGLLDELLNMIGIGNIDSTRQMRSALQNHIPIGAILSQMRYKNAAGYWREGPVIVSYFPLFNEAGDKFEGILELNQAIDEPWANLERLQIVTSISTFFVLLGLFILLLFYSRRIEKIIDKQQEINVELASAKVRAESESQEKSKFLANVSHELRTPLNAIIGFSEIIKSESMGPIGNATYKDYINDILNSGQHLLSLITDILDYSKAEAEKLIVNSVPISVGKIARSTARLMEARAEQGQVKLITEIPKDEIIILGDQKRMKQIILNLMSNSIKFTPENGSVTLRVKFNAAEKTVDVQVADTGIGIPAKDIARAMAVFGQVDNKLSRKYEGTGLGLPLTKKLVDLMHGKFNIMSQEGFGTTVTATFALNELIAHKVEAAPAEPAAPAPVIVDTRPADVVAPTPPAPSAPTEQPKS